MRASCALLRVSDERVAQRASRSAGAHGRRFSRLPFRVVIFYGCIIQWNEYIYMYTQYKQQCLLRNAHIKIILRRKSLQPATVGKLFSVIWIFVGKKQNKNRCGSLSAGAARGSFLPWWSDMLLHLPSVTKMESYIAWPDGKAKGKKKK